MFVGRVDTFMAFKYNWEEGKIMSFNIKIHRWIFFAFVFFSSPSILRTNAMNMVYCSVKSTIDRYKKATADTSNTGSICEANAQVQFKLSTLLVMEEK